MKEKTCRACNLTKPIEKFVFKYKKANTRENICKLCYNRKKYKPKNQCWSLVKYDAEFAQQQSKRKCLTKRCSLCKETKPSYEFRRNFSKEGGYRSECKTCDSKTHKKWYEAHGRTKYLQGHRFNSRIKRFEEFVSSRIGRTFNRLTIIGFAGRNSTSGESLWYCRCSCGNEKVVTNECLRRGKVRSCGCLREEQWKHRRTGYGEITGTFWAQIVAGAKNREIPFEISIEYIWDLFLKQNRRCILTGDLLFLTQNLQSEPREDSPLRASLDRIDSSLGYIEGNVQWIGKYTNLSKGEMTQCEFISFCRRVSEYTKGICV